ncbi:SpoIIE family protein phosphatase [Streptomyces sp. NPDC058741]|uniref:SpoIIE family protein phosphatase n=1 Tax=unclassified Streptomyces TaxID=2593676 RepID=UPI0036A993C3
MAGRDDAERRPPARADVFSADDVVGAALAAVDWTGTPVGPPDGWPQSLRTAVSTLLSSRFAMWMAWGPELTFFCNDAYRRDTLGRKFPWALGRPAREVWAEVWDDAAPRIATVLATGQATWDEGLLLFLERSGYPEETYHTFSYSPLRDDCGVVVGMLCVVSEETTRIVGDRRMATLRDLGSDPGVARTEPETLDFAARQLARNPQDLPFTCTYLFQDDGSARLSVSTGIAAGHPAAPPVVRSDDPAAVWPAGRPARGENVLVDLDGPAFDDLPAGSWPRPPAQALVVPLPRQGDSPYGFLVAGLNRYRPPDDTYRGFVELVAHHLAAGIGSARSYAAQQRRAEELAELDRAKTAFFSNISHEFRTPLTLIMGPVEELLARRGDDPGLRAELEAVRRNGLRMGRLVNALLDFSRIEAGRMRAVYEPVDLAAVTAELASVFRSAVEKAGLAFEVDCPPLDRPVHLDRGMWEKVVLNLLSNALKFTFDGTIRVAVRTEDGRAEVTVSDTGIGVPAEEMPRLFERFHRIESARSRSHEGSGIGLALVKELVGLHGGTITADSTEGRGSSFTVRLPFAAAPLPTGDVPADPAPVSSPDPFVQEALRWLPDGSSPAVTAARQAPEGALAVVGDARVVVADDNADMREYLQRLLTGAGYRVTTVTDGTSALDAVRADPPELVVSDVMMPGLDGLALVAALRSEPRTASIPVLLLSARAGQEASIEGLQAGADDYLVKPFAAAELLARVRANVGLARLRTHHLRWRTALIDSLQEAFFVCDEEGAVIEINTAFSEMLGYSVEGLPYGPVHPWWPDADTDPDAYKQVRAAFDPMTSGARKNLTIPVRHRDGHRLWVSATFNTVEDSDTGRHRAVGTFRDVTAEHFAVQRDTALAALSTRLSEAAGLTEALVGALFQLKELWRARSVLAAVLGPRGEPVVTATDPSVTWTSLPDGGRRFLEQLGREPMLAPVTTKGGAGILLGHPEGPLALWVDLGERRPFTGEDQLLLTLLAGHLAQGLVRVHQIDQQRETAIALQRAILGPSRLPAGFAVRYEPATRPLEVGGDWYDTVSLPDGRIGIVVGDCVGHGLESASVMGQLRSACRALLLQEPNPARTLMALDQFAAGVPGAVCTTVFCGVLEPATGRLVYSSAGHPPGILALPDGTVRLLEEGRALPLAVRPGRERPQASCTVPGRGTLLLYTDGLVERRRRSLADGMEEAGRAVQEGRDAGVEELASRIMRQLEPEGGYTDDVALLLYHHPVPLEVEFPARSAQLGVVRKALRDWLDQCALPRHIVQNVLVAAGEACANAIEHGHRDSPGGTIRLSGRAHTHDLCVTVADTGRWKDPRPEQNLHRGRGVKLMRALMRQVTITPGPDGTVVEMQTRTDR